MKRFVFVLSLVALPMRFVCLPMPGQEIARRVPPPGPLTQTFSKFGLSLRMPSNWIATSNEDGSVWMLLPPEAKLSSNWITHGVWVGVFPSQKYTLEEYNLVQRGDVRGIANRLFLGFQQQVPLIRKMTEQEQETAGFRSYTIIYHTEPPPGIDAEAEHGGLIVMQPKPGQPVWFFIMFAPHSDWENEQQVYPNLFLNMMATLHPEGSAEPSGGSTRPSGVVPIANQELLTAQEREVLHRIVGRAQKGRYQLPSGWQIVIRQDNSLNAAASGQTVVLNAGAVHILAKDEGELAFLLFHELGHIWNRSSDEKRADETGLMYLIGSRYSPYDAAAMFGKMLMYAGGGTVLEAVGIWLSDNPADQHPWTIHRIDELRKLSLRFCDENPGVCQW